MAPGGGTGGTDGTGAWFHHGHTGAGSSTGAGEGTSGAGGKSSSHSVMHPWCTARQDVGHAAGHWGEPGGRPQPLRHPLQSDRRIICEQQLLQDQIAFGPAPSPPAASTGVCAPASGVGSGSWGSGA